MNIVIYTSRGGKPRSLHVRHWWQGVLLSAAVVTSLVGLVSAGFYWGSQRPPEEYVVAWQNEINAQQKALETVRSRATADINALSARIGQLQSHVTRLDALGSRLVTMADIDSEEFDFVRLPALGGPSDEVALDVADLDQLESAIMDLDRDLQDRAAQLSVLEQVIAEQNLNDQVYPQGRPIQKGWLSSYYGWRTNPFGGNKEFHKGLDFAGREGSDVLAVAGGVVTWAGSRYGYGNLVEINHGNGYVTRYGHNKDILVTEGQAIKKGEVISKMGSTGRSTGPHVHFEVIRNGRKIDPVKYISRR